MVKKIGESLVFYFFLSVIIFLCVMLLRSIFIPISPPLEELETQVTPRRRFILDPGHGGKDGGAVSVTGTEEKILNLDICLTMSEALHVLGYEVVLTRDSDIELTHESGGTRKMQDLKGRLEIAANNCDAPFISIHMNKFPVEKYNGLQVYYSPNNAESLLLAQSVQNGIVRYLHPNNNRKIKKAGSSIFLLYTIKSPAILIECGFLSNRNEAELLDSIEYRQKLSFNILTALINTYERQGNEN